MGLRDYLANRRARMRSEKRIQRQSKRLYAKPKTGLTPFERRMERIGDKGVNIAERVYEETQRRKGRGREIIIERFHRIVGTAPGAIRELVRDPNASKNKTKSNRIKMPSPPGSMKIRKRRRR